MMAMLFVFMVIMGLLLMKAQPYARAQVMRDREAELVFRGEAIARAIKLYQVRTGRFPASFEELLIVRPRILRRVYRDPMVADGEWRKLYAVQPGASGDTTGLPIVGVASKSDEDRTYRVYQGKTMYADWHFRADSNVFSFSEAARQLAPATGKDARPPAPGEPTGGKK